LQVRGKSAFVIVSEMFGYQNPSSIGKVLTQAEARGFKGRLEEVAVPRRRDGAGESPNDFEEREAARKGERGFAPVLKGFEISRTSATLHKNGAVVRQTVRQAPERGPVFEPPEGTRRAGNRTDRRRGPSRRRRSSTQ
jgi:hypothetical protein